MGLTSSAGPVRSTPTVAEPDPAWGHSRSRAVVAAGRSLPRDVAVQVAGGFEHGRRLAGQLRLALRDGGAQRVAAPRAAEAVEDLADLGEEIAPLAEHGDHA